MWEPLRTRSASSRDGAAGTQSPALWLPAQAPATRRHPEVALPRVALIALAITLATTLALPLILASPANLTSDESLYLAEAHAIARGDGLVYPSGAPITHRAPLFPLLLAPAVRAGRANGPYVLAKVIVSLNALLVAGIAWRMAGGLAGVAAGVAAGGSAFLNGLGATLYLDPLESMFVLVAVGALGEAIRTPRASLFAVAGASVGLSFLTKEAAVQYLPLGIVAWLIVPALRNHTGARGALAFSVAFAAVVAPWFVWVWLQTSTVFMLGDVGLLYGICIGGGAVAFALFTLGVGSWPAVPARVKPSLERLAVPAATALGLAWGGTILYMLERHDAWNYPVSYWATVPRYLTTVAPAAQPFFILVAAVAWILFRAVKGDHQARLLAISFLMFSPLALFAANRSLQLRDALPMLYVAYLAFGVTFGALARWTQERIETPAQELAAWALVAIAAAVFVGQQAHSFTTSNTEAASIGVRADSWDSSFVREIATSLEGHVPRGANVLSSRLYFSSLYVQTDGHFHIRQMPTVGVNVATDDQHLLVRRSNLFRWEDAELRPARPGDTWIWLKRFEGKQYWVGLSEQELLEYIAGQQIDYVLLTGEDAAFSSLHAAAYLSGNPAFKLVEARRRSASDQFYLYRVDRLKLARIPHSTVLSPTDAGALASETGWSFQRIEQALGAPLRASDGDFGLSQREEQAAVDGIDLGLR